MPNAKAASRYSAVAQTFHWVIAALVIVQFFLANQYHNAPLAKKIAPIATHKSVGMTILMLAIMRLVWRLFNPPPGLPQGMSRLEQIGAKFTHFAFYFLLFAMPLSGWLMSSAKNYSVSYFGLFTWPDLVKPNEQAFDLLKETHETLSTVLLVLAILHVLAALKHHFWNKDDVLKRMLPFTKSEKRT
jgi:cytochrome b561